MNNSPCGVDLDEDIIRTEFNETVDLIVDHCFDLLDILNNCKLDLCDEELATLEKKVCYLKEYVEEHVKES